MTLVMITGTGLTGVGAGAGHQIFTHDVPVPVWAGDRGVTGSHQHDMTMYIVHVFPPAQYQRFGQL